MSINTVESRMDRLRSRTYKGPKTVGVPHVRGVPNTQSSTNTIYYWVLGYTDNGKRCVLGPCTSDGEALELADSLNDSETIELKTRDQTKAVKQIRALLLRRGESADVAIERQLHEKGLARELAL